MDYFHKFFQKQAQRETVVYAASKESSLPEGYYAFLESYCSNPACDCKKVVIYIEPQSNSELTHFERSAVPTAVLEYAWENPISEQNPSIHPQAPKSLLAKSALTLFREYLQTHPAYLEKLNQHYSMMKKMGETLISSDLGYFVSMTMPQKPKIGRNEPCSCGSGKKFKKCCSNTELSQGA